MVQIVMPPHTTCFCWIIYSSFALFDLHGWFHVYIIVDGLCLFLLWTCAPNHCFFTPMECSRILIFSTHTHTPKDMQLPKNPAISHISQVHLLHLWFSGGFFWRNTTKNGVQKGPGSMRAMSPPVLPRLWLMVRADAMFKAVGAQPKFRNTHA